MFWSIAAIVPARKGVTNGHVATLEEAKVRFRREWETGTNAPAASAGA